MCLKCGSRLIPRLEKDTEKLHEHDRSRSHQIDIIIHSSIMYANTTLRLILRTCIGIPPPPPPFKKFQVTSADQKYPQDDPPPKAWVAPWRMQWLRSEIGRPDRSV